MIEVLFMVTWALLSVAVVLSLLWDELKEVKK